MPANLHNARCNFNAMQHSNAQEKAVIVSGVRGALHNFHAAGRSSHPMPDARTRTQYTDGPVLPDHRARSLPALHFHAGTSPFHQLEDELLNALSGTCHWQCT